MSKHHVYCQISNDIGTFHTTYVSIVSGAIVLPKRLQPNSTKGRENK